MTNSYDQTKKQKKKIMYFKIFKGLTYFFLLYIIYINYELMLCHFYVRLVKYDQHAYLVVD